MINLNQVQSLENAPPPSLESANTTKTHRHFSEDIHVANTQCSAVPEGCDGADSRQEIAEVTSST